MNWTEIVKTLPDFSPVIKVHKKWFHLEDEDYIKVLHAVIITHKFDAKSVWLLIVSPPSGMKTSILTPLNILKDLYNVRGISELTARTLVSGYKNYSGLLEQMVNGILAFKDFTTILKLQADTRNEILQQLREVWDGAYTKQMGTGKEIRWKGKITFIAGTTEYFETYREIEGILGERYLLYKPVIEGRNEMTLKALNQIGKEKEMEEEIENAIVSYHQNLLKTLETLPKIKVFVDESRYYENIDVSSIPVNPDIYKKIIHLADFVTRARSSPSRDYRHEITYVPEPELPARLSKQLICIGKGLAVINRSSEVGEEEYKIMVKLGMMTISSDRLKVLKVLIHSPSGLVATRDIRKEVGLPRNVVFRILENLECFGLVSSEDPISEGMDKFWRLTDLVQKCIKEGELFFENAIILEEKEDEI